MFRKRIKRLSLKKIIQEKKDLHEDLESPVSGFSIDINSLEPDTGFSIYTDGMEFDTSLLTESNKQTFHEIPRIIHFVWVGGPIKSKYLKNIAAITEQASRSGFTVNLWLDHKRNYEKTAIASDIVIPNLVIRNIDEIKFSPEESMIIGSEMLGAKNLAAASDLIRYKILLKEGGNYFDTDTTFNTKFTEILAPDSARYGVLFHASGMEWLQFNNDIIASTKNNIILNLILDKVKENYKKLIESGEMQNKRLNANEKRKLTIKSSGPGVIIDVLKEYSASIDKSEFKRAITFKRYYDNIIVAGLRVKGEYDQTWLGKNKSKSFDDFDIKYSNKTGMKSASSTIFPDDKIKKHPDYQVSSSKIKNKKEKNDPVFNISKK